MADILRARAIAPTLNRPAAPRYKVSMSFAEFFDACSNAEGKVGLLSIVIRNPATGQWIEPPPGLSPKQIQEVPPKPSAKPAPRLK
jgi:hypothetical protein